MRRRLYTAPFLAGAIVACAGAVVTAPARGDTFGKATAGASTFYLSADYKAVSSFTLPAAASVSSVTVNLKGSGTSGAQPLRAVVYADSGGNPGSLAATSQEVMVAFNAPRAWVQFAFASAVSLPSGTYWLGIQAGTGTGDALSYYGYDTVTAAQRTRFDGYTDGPSDPFGSPTTKDRQMAVYATYTAAGPVPPANTSPPTITGTAQAGQALTASTGTWFGTAPLTYAYQWRDCDAAGANCVDIAGATGSTYVVGGADVGATIRVVVTASNSAGSSSATSAPTAAVVAAPVPPASTSPPQVTGTAQDGSTLTADPGSWSGTQPISFAYQWRRCDSGATCVDIVPAAAPTYTLTSADIGSTIRVVVTASNSGGTSSATSAPSGVVAALPPASTSAPTISGVAQVGETLTAPPGGWSGTPPLSYAYQWRRCGTGSGCTDVFGATGSTYAVGAGDVGSALVVQVTASNTAGTATAVSAPTQAVTAPAEPPSNSTPPTILGTAQDGATLIADPGTWSGTGPLSYAYQWRRCDGVGSGCVDIVTASTASYTATPADVGSTLRVVVTASNSAGSSSATSAQTTAVVAVAPANTSPPTVSGVTREGQTLTAGAGSWTGTPPLAYAYQWRRCDPSDGSCVGLDGAVQPTYTLTSSDVGAVVRVKVTASNAAGSAVASSTNTDVVVASAVPPTNTSPPTISGVAQDGLSLTADPGTWSGAAPFAYAYEWHRCDASGGGCVPIGGASASRYTAVAADVGSTIRVAVTASNSGGSSTATSAPTAVVAAAPPVNTSPPTISGPSQQGQTLSAATGSWSGTPPLSYAYQWRRCDAGGGACTAVAGATAATYTIGSGDVGSTLRIAVTTANSAGSTTSVSAATPLVVGATTVLASFGKTTPGAANTSTAADYKLVSKFTLGEDGTLRKLTAYLEGTGSSGAHVLRGIVYADSGGKPGALKAATQEISIPYNQPKAWVDLPLATGVALPAGDYWLGLHVGGATGTALAYYSYDAVSNAQRTKSDGYADGPSDPFGSASTKSRQMAVYATYSPTAPTPPTNTVAPSISGTAAVQQTLTAAAGTWSGTAPITYAYQWRRCDQSGSGCADIAGATLRTYVVASADLGSTLRVNVIASNAVGSGSAVSAATVTVSPPIGDPVVMAAGDIACGTASVGGSCAQAATSNLLVSGNTTAVLALGDEQYECGSLSDFQSFYAPSWGRMKPTTYPAPGNHEYNTSSDPADSCYGMPDGAPGYFGYFGALATPRQPSCTVSCLGYYSFDLGNWHLVAINSNCDQVGGCAAGSAEEQWLRQDLAATTKACILAFWHHPRYASGGQGTESTTLDMHDIWNDLYNVHADLVLAGHDHVYERFAQLGRSTAGSYEPTVDTVNGMREIVVGTGGRSHGSFPSTIRTGSEVRNKDTFGVLKLTLHSLSYEWQFVPVAGGTFGDSGSTPCH